MSSVVALKANGKVYVASDSQIVKGDVRGRLDCQPNYKIWKTPHLENSIMGHCGVVQDTGVIKVTDLFDDEIRNSGNIDFNYLQGKLIPKMYQIFKDSNYLENKDTANLPSAFLFTYKDKIFEISKDMLALEHEEYFTMGSSSITSGLSLKYTRGEDPVIRVIKAVDTCCKVDNYVNYPIIVTDTESREFKIYTKEEVEKLVSKK